MPFRPSIQTSRLLSVSAFAALALFTLPKSNLLKYHVDCFNCAGGAVPSRQHTVLASGWDESAYEKWLSTTRDLTSALLHSNASVLEYKTYPLGSVRAHRHPSIVGGQWLQASVDDTPKWELATFRAFLTFVPGHTHYVDFGTWIGPTLFYGAQLVTTSYGVEADPVAFASVTTNVLLNQDKLWGKSIHVQPGAVGIGSIDSTAPVVVNMRSAKAGNSCSGIGEWDKNCGEVKENWTVNSYTLPALLKLWGLDASDTFIKVDTEAFECKLVPSWVDWLKYMETRPTFYISFHSYVSNCTEEEYEAISRFARLFKRVIVDSNTNSYEIVDTGTDTKFQLMGETVIFSDK